MLLCENKALVTGVAASWVNVLREPCGMTEERPTLVPALTKVDSCGQQMDWLPCIPIEGGKKKPQPKQVSLLEHWSLWSTAHLRLQSKTSWDPSVHMESHLYKQGQGGMCEQCNQRILFSKHRADLANEWFVWFKSLSVVVWLNATQGNVFNQHNTSGKTCFSFYQHEVIEVP